MPLKNFTDNEIQKTVRELLCLAEFIRGVVSVLSTLNIFLSIAALLGNTLILVRGRVGEDRWNEVTLVTPGGRGGSVNFLTQPVYSRPPPFSPAFDFFLPEGRGRLYTCYSSFHKKRLNACFRR